MCQGSRKLSGRAFQRFDRRSRSSFRPRECQQPAWDSLHAREFRDPSRGVQLQSSAWFSTFITLVRDDFEAVGVPVTLSRVPSSSLEYIEQTGGWAGVSRGDGRKGKLVENLR